MTGIIVAGHGHFLTGLLSTITLVVGRPENTAEVDFPRGCSLSSLREAMIGPVKAPEGEEILILTNLMGGTPFNVAAALGEELRDRRVKTVTGVNIAGLVGTIFFRPVYGLNELAIAVLVVGRRGIGGLDCLDSEGQGLRLEDGLQRIRQHKDRERET